MQSAKKKFHYSNFIFFHRFCNDDVLSALPPRSNTTLAAATILDFVFRFLLLVVEMGENALYRWWILHAKALFLGPQRLDGLQGKMSQGIFVVVAIFLLGEYNYRLLTLPSSTEKS